MIHSTLLHRISEEIDGYTPSFRQVSRVILDQSEQIKYMSVAALANLCSVSEPTVLRFCRMLGFAGFRDFKLRLAEDEGSRNNGLNICSDALSGSLGYIRQMGAVTITAINEVIQMLAAQDLDSAVNKLADAAKIEFWGQCASAAVAQDAYDKFFTAGIPCYVTTENSMQKMSAGLFTTSDVIVAISHTGANVDLIKNVEIAKAQGAFVLGITIADSPVARACTQTIAINISENNGIFSAMVLRVAHLFVLDTLAVGVLLRKDALKEKELTVDIGATFDPEEAQKVARDLVNAAEE